MKNRICLIGLTLILSTGLWGVDSQCKPQLPSGSAAMLVEYYHPVPLDPFQCDPGKRCTLSGWLYIPMHDHGPVELPMLIYNHGSGKDKAEPCAVARYFLQKGYMVFAPYRRGYTERYSDNDPAHDNHPYIINNSGTYVGDYIDRFHTLDDQRRGEVWYLKDEVRDVQAALTFMTTFSLTNVTNNDSVRMNKKLVYMLGRSFGGIVTMFAAAANLVPLPNAVVTISGAAESMTLDDHPANQGLNPYYKEVLPAALYGRRMPIFFAQPANEASLLPTTFLPTFAAISSLHLMEAGTFPPVLPDPNECQHTPANCDANGSLIPNEIHTRFTSSYQHVKDWGPAILAFFELYQ